MRIKPKTIRIVKENVELGSFALPAVVLVFLFSYLPMFGIVLAFKNYKVTKGILGSDWINPLWKNFEFFLTSKDAPRVIRNTLSLNFLFIFVCILCAVIFALLLYEVKKPWQIKTYQTFSILPCFLSWVAVGYIVYGFLEPTKGILNQIIRALGGEGVPWYTEPKYWPTILTVVNVWHGVGLNCIMYYAALMGIDSQLFEAAELDGASKFRRIWHISLPHLVPIITIKGLLDIGQIFRADFGLFYNVTRDMGQLYPVTDVMDTYVFRALQTGNIGMSSASSVIQSVVCFFTIIIANAIVRKISPENSLF